MDNEQKEHEHHVKKVGDKYYCTECEHEVLAHRECPTCKLHIDWDQVSENWKVGL